MGRILNTTFSNQKIFLNKKKLPPQNYQNMEMLLNCLQDIINLIESDHDIVFLVFSFCENSEFNISVIFTMLFFSIKFNWSLKKSKKFLCPQMILFSEEFYIQQDLIADLFELIIKTHPLKSEVVIINESLLPIYKKK